MSSQRWKEENRDKQRGYERKYYLANKQIVIAKNAARKRALQEWIESLKSTLKCVRCDDDDFVCLDFHHTNPDEKEISVSRAVTNGWSKKRILDEIAKCKVICASCHRKLHAGRFVLCECECSTMAVRESSKLHTRVRSPSLAPIYDSVAEK